MKYGISSLCFINIICDHCEMTDLLWEDGSEEEEEGDELQGRGLTCPQAAPHGHHQGQPAPYTQ